MKKYKNPIILNSAEGNTSDPYVIKHNELYYHCYSNEKGIFVSESETVWDIGSGRKKLVYSIESPEELKAWYAPELHYINGKWYIYVAPDYGDDLHVMTVLECDGETPMAEFKNLGMIKGLENEWSIDGTVFQYNERLYFIWATGFEMQMSEMLDPCTLTGKRITITKPEYDFEKVWGEITEGPAVLKRGDKIHIVYSASDSQCDDYCLGLLTCQNGCDILDIANWKKATAPVFKKTSKILGPGHCSFTTVRENGEDVNYIVYHANLESGTGWRGRSVFAQAFSFDENDMPIFGEPQF